MNHSDWTVAVPLTAAAWREKRVDDIEDTLRSELADQVLDLIVDACTSGGSSDDELLEIDKIQIDEQAINARVRIAFVEVIPSGCSDIPHREDRDVERLLTLRAGDDRAYVDYSPCDPNQWEVWERNSAADGT